MNIFFPSTHGSLTVELATLCQQTGNKMFLLAVECSLAHGAGQGAHPAHECAFFDAIGVETIASNEVLRDRIQEADLFVVVTPLQVDLARRIAKCPVAVIAGLPEAEPSVRIFNGMKINNHLSPSARHLAMLTGRNKLLYPKLLRKDTFRRPAAEDRSGFCSYVHWMERDHPISATKLRTLNLISRIPLKNFGFGSQHGVVDDLDCMRKAKATVHLKDHGLTCNAPIRSLASGTAVVMDDETYRNGFFDSVNGMTVVATIDDIAKEIDRLDNDVDYLRERSWEAERASQQFVYRPEHGDAFASFLKSVS